MLGVLFLFQLHSMRETLPYHPKFVIFLATVIGQQAIGTLLSSPLQLPQHWGYMWLCQAFP